MKRMAELALEEHFEQNRQMLFLMGPRQVGKTTVSQHLSKSYSERFFFNWDNPSDRLKILEGPNQIAQNIQYFKLKEQKPFVSFDEVHKYEHWKDFLKGFFDTYPNCATLVTGSARLNVLKNTGDSLMGRYFNFRLHPITLGELAFRKLREEEINENPSSVSDEEFDGLFRFGGFPEPFLKSNQRFYNRWRNLRNEQLFNEDLRDLNQVHKLGQFQTLLELLRHQIGELTTLSSLSSKIGISVDTAKKWIEILQNFYFCFSVRPWSTNVTRSLIKEPKYYLWDWAYVPNEGARIENFVASHLLKAVHFWTDYGLGRYELHFLRDKEKREVDFLVTRNEQPWFLVEVKKSSKQSLSEHLYYFQKQTQATHAFQCAFDMPFVARNCFEHQEPIMVPVKTLLAQLI